MTSFWLGLVTILISSSLALSSPALAAPKDKAKKNKKAQSKEFILSPDKSTSQLLKQLKNARGKARVSLTLKSGAIYSGTVGEIGQQNFILQSISQKDFYDAVISYSAIEALEIQMRGFPPPPAVKKEEAPK